MSQAGDVLRRAAADVEVRGVLHDPDDGETCTLFAIEANAPQFPIDYYSVCCEALALSLGISADGENLVAGRASLVCNYGLIRWNDSQPSRAVVAASMREAADLADLLYGGDAA